MANVHIFKEENVWWWILENKRVKLEILSYFKIQLLKSDLWAMKTDSDPQCCGLSQLVQSLKVPCLPWLVSFPRCLLSRGHSSPVFARWLAFLFIFCCCSLALSLQAACPERGVISDPGWKVTCCLYSNGLFILLHTEEGFSWLRIIPSPGRFFSAL